MLLLARLIKADEENCLPSLQRTRGDSKKRVKLQRPKREKYRRSPLYRGSQLWDELSQADQQIESIHTFKTRLKKIIK